MPQFMVRGNYVEHGSFCAAVDADSMSAAVEKIESGEANIDSEVWASTYDVTFVDDATGKRHYRDDVVKVWRVTGGYTQDGVFTAEVPDATCPAEALKAVENGEVEWDANPKGGNINAWQITGPDGTTYDPGDYSDEADELFEDAVSGPWDPVEDE
jgi:hypothetical protein